MQNKFSTSVNIIRDGKSEFNYFPTPNANKVITQIVNDFKLGIRSFNIIGSYGTGKSSLLWGIQQTLSNKKKYFHFNLLNSPKVDFINIIGEYSSIRKVFSEYFEITSKKNIDENIFSKIYNRYHDLGKKDSLLVIQIDEFGKFLEYAAINEPENELYFIQKLTEFVNNFNNNIILLTTIHQNFDAYSNNLTSAQRNEWSKVKGRFREISFNEPVDQLLYLASEHIKLLGKKNINPTIFDKVSNIYHKSKVFNSNSNFVKEISCSLFPLDILSASIITLALQRYGQNERSLFTFLQTNDSFAHKNIVISQESFFHIGNVYDYLIENFYSFISSKNNPDFISWQSIKIALERSEGVFTEEHNCYSQLIKTIGLLNLFAAASSVLDKDFLVQYAKYCLNIKNAGSFIEELEKKKIILFRNFSKRYILFEGTDLDIHLALNEAGNKISLITDITSILKKYFQIPVTLAKEISYTNGTPRLFEFRISKYPIHDIPEGEIDGFVNLIFNEEITTKSLLEESSLENEAILYCLYKNSKSIKDLLFEIEKTQKVIEENLDDKVAVHELQNIIFHQKNLLNHRILNITSGGKDVIWVYKGKQIAITNKRSFNRKLSDICKDIYPKSPIFINELVNRNKISASIHLAKKNYYKAIIDNWEKEQLGFSTDKYPPEKTIYLSLLNQNNISTSKNITEIGKSIKKDNFFHFLWDESITFINSAKSSRKRISDLYSVLSQKPYKIKKGLLDFWIPTFIFLAREELALFNKDIFLPQFNYEILELIAKYPTEYEIKAFDIAGIKFDIFNQYRQFLNQSVGVPISNSSFIETIKPFLIFYRNLPEYTKNTKRLSREAEKVLNVLKQAKDPEKVFFDDLPNALNISFEKFQNSKELIAEFTNRLQDTIRELRLCYEELINRIEDFIKIEIVGENLSFEDYKIRLQERYKNLKRHLLLAKQKTFVQRLDSQIDDKNAWLNSISQSLIGISLDKITDEDEILLYDRFKDMILKLDSLIEISNSNFIEGKENVVRFQIDSYNKGSKSRIIRVPVGKSKPIKGIEENIKKQFSNDKTLNIVALVNLLNELMKNE